MSFIGITVRIAGGRPLVHGIVLDDAGEQSAEIYHLANMSQDVATQLEELGSAIHSALLAHVPQIVVLREANRSPAGERRHITVARARAEGVVIATCRAQATAVKLMNGAAIGRVLGGDQAAADEQARAWASPDYVKAGAAALTAKSLSAER